MATDSTDEVEIESARPQHRASNQKSSLSPFPALCLVSCDQSEKTPVANSPQCTTVNTCKGRRGEGENPAAFLGQRSTQT